ncbi:MAG: tetratricopeptide repeat protein [Spirochaetales bacterium]|nr:tetratricopeptide repeat protein [Spirochaetales bacterium]
MYLVSIVQYEKNKDLPAARAYYKKALDRDPFFSYACNNLGVSYFLNGDYMTARDYFEKALESDSSDPDAWFNLRDTYTELGMTAEAESADLKYHELVRH